MKIYILASSKAILLQKWISYLSIKIFTDLVFYKDTEKIKSEAVKSCSSLTAQYLHLIRTCWLLCCSHQFSGFPSPTSFTTTTLHASHTHGALPGKDCSLKKNTSLHAGDLMLNPQQKRSQLTRSKGFLGEIWEGCWNWARRTDCSSWQHLATPYSDL